MGILYKNGIPYGGGGDNSIIITYEEYQNLSEAEKNSNITYYIPDYPDYPDTRLLFEDFTIENTFTITAGTSVHFGNITPTIPTGKQIASVSVSLTDGSGWIVVSSSLDGNIISLRGKNTATSTLAVTKVDVRVWYK